MGITNLLQFLKPITYAGHVEDCKGQIVGVDAMCWMHRGAAACAVEIVEGRESDKFLRFFISMVSLLRFYGVTPLVVFDGSRLDVKSGEDEKRRLRRETARREALQLLDRKRRNLPVDHKELMSKCSQSISITQAMVDKVIAACRELGIRCIVAPFEADAQLAYLSRTNQIYSAISEDSDLLAYGCKRVMLKMDKDGRCDVIRLPFLQDDQDQPEVSCREPRTAKQQELLRSLKGITHEQFIAMCVLGGCDYTNHVHINGMGIATAHRLVTQLRSLKKVLDFLCRDKKWSSRFPLSKEEVIAGHLEAEKTFMQHKVFDPRTRRVVLIRSHDTQAEGPCLFNSDEETNGRDIEIASGLLDPRTGTMRQTVLSPAECELIKECQERAFSGLESQQLKAQFAAFNADELQKQGQVRPRKEASIQESRQATTARQEAGEQKATTKTTIHIAMRCADGASDVTRGSSRGCSQTAALDAFTPPRTLLAFGEIAVKDADTCANSSHVSERFGSEMGSEGFQVSKAPADTDAAPGQSKTNPETADSGDAEGLMHSAAAAAVPEQENAIKDLGNSCAAAVFSLSQFAFPGSAPTSAKAGRRDVVTRTRFAHRTKLLSASTRPQAPFTSLAAMAATVNSAGAASGQLPKASAFVLETEPKGKRKSVGFLNADDSNGSCGFLSIHFAQDEPKKHRLL